MRRRRGGRTIDQNKCIATDGNTYLIGKTISGVVFLGGVPSRAWLFAWFKDGKVRAIDGDAWLFAWFKDGTVRAIDGDADADLSIILVLRQICRKYSCGRLRHRLTLHFVR